MTMTTSIKSLAFSTLATSLLALPSANAQKTTTPAQIIRDDQGLARCLQIENDGVLLVWEQVSDLYQREITAIRLSEVKYKQGDHDKFTEGRLDCNEWEMMTGHAKRMLNKSLTLIEEGSSQALGVTLSQDVQASLHQVRSGATVFVSDYDSETLQPDTKSIIRNESLTLGNFDVERNRELSKKYGMGQVGRVYKALLETDPYARQFSQFIEENKTKSLSLAERLGKTRILVAPGYMDGPEQSVIRPLLDSFAALGIKVERLQLDSLQTIGNNAHQIVAQLDNITSNGEDVILFGASKGAPEILAALWYLRDYIDHKLVSPEVYGQVKAVVTLAGMTASSFWVEWGKTRVLWEVLKWTSLKKKAKELGVDENNTPLRPGFVSMAEKTTSYIYEKIGDELPISPVYVNAISVLPGNGLAADPDIRALQDQMARKGGIFPKHGANDGFMEYPGTSFPVRWRDNGLEFYPFVGSASHKFLDGTFAGFSLVEEAQRQGFVESFMHSVLDAIDLKERNKN